MKKEELLKLYEDYLQENPQNIYIKNINNSSHNQINRMYIQDNTDLTDEEVPDYLTMLQLFKIDEEHNHTLTWKILESDVTEEKIAEFEQENDVTLPQMFREYLQGYTILQENFYPKCMDSEEISLVWLYFSAIDNPSDKLSLEYFGNIGMIDLGILECPIGNDMVLLDCETGEVQSWDHEINNAFRAKSKEEFEEESMAGLFWSKDFDTFLEWVFGKTAYDYEKAEEEQRDFYAQHHAAEICR